MTFVGRGAGTFGSVGVAYLESGDQFTGTASGTFESAGANRWSPQSIIHISDGSAILSEGVIDLAARTWNGKMYEWN